MKISVIFGTRPEAIKLVPVILRLRKYPELFDCRVCVTAQHREMLDQVMKTFDIVPDVDLNLMVQDQTLASFTSRAIFDLDQYLKQEQPDLVIVQGDTTTVFTAALAAFYNQIPLAHVEAGLRTGDLRAPYPEELNRVMVSRLASIHFAPTISNRDNLVREGIKESAIFITGNTVIDTLLIAVDKIRDQRIEIPGLNADLFNLLLHKEMVLITGHRRENFGMGFENLCSALLSLAARFPEVHFIYPVHLNPHVQEPVRNILGDSQSRNIHLIPPLSYLPFVKLMTMSKLILTDSGGIQEEAPSLGKPVLVMREVTERQEGVNAGTVRVIGTRSESIIEGVSDLLLNDNLYHSMVQATNPYGDGKAAERICNILISMKNHTGA